MITRVVTEGWGVFDDVQQGWLAGDDYVRRRDLDEQRGDAEPGEESDR